MHSAMGKRHSHTSTTPLSFSNSQSSVCTLKSRESQTSIRSFFVANRRSSILVPRSRSSHGAQPPTNSHPPATLPGLPPTPDFLGVSVTLESSKGETVTTLKSCLDSQRPSNKRSAGVAINIQKKRLSKHQQLYLDLGQRNFAANMFCGVCGMMFVHGLAEDAQRHTAECQDYVQGVAFHAGKQQLRILSKWSLQKKNVREQAIIIEVCLCRSSKKGNGLN